MKNALLFFVLIFATIVASCSKSENKTSVCQGGDDEFSLNEPFTLCYGTSAHFDDNASFILNFSSVYGDSRCALDALCVWEGRVDVGLICSFGQIGGLDTLSKSGLNANTAKDSIFFEGYKIKLLSVEPYPAIAGDTIPSEDYKLQLVVSQ